MTVRRAPDVPENRVAQGHRGLGLGWAKRGRAKEAIAAFERALAVEPSYLEAHLDLARLLFQLHRWRDVADVCTRALRHFLEIPELHKLRIAALDEIEPPEAADALYGLERIDGRELALGERSILCCLAVRNEIVRLPAFLAHYRKLGVDRFLAVDNGSDDGTLELLAAEPDVHLWCSSLSFRLANFGSVWFELLLRRHGVGRWCLTVDADELLVYDGWQERPLRAFCDELERRGQEAASGVLLDLYSDRAVGETRLEPGGDLLELCPWFDREFYHRRYEGGGQYRNQRILFGGVRQRVFPAEHDYLLSKVPLLRYGPHVVLASGQHLTNLPAERIAHEQVCLLHFKFLSSFPAYARDEAVRAVHAMAGEQYKAYAAVLDRGEAVVLRDPELSVRFEGIRQLRDLGVLGPAPGDDRPRFPRIAPVDTAGGPRPFWSVMITIYDRPWNLERAVGGVLGQAGEDMEIAVVYDGGDAAIARDLADRLRALAGDRVALHDLGRTLGHPHVFNACLERARGEWVHVLHDDDGVEPGFYAALRDGIRRAPAVGAAFTQHAIVSSGGEEGFWRSWVERETPGVVEDWLERIAVECRGQFSAMTVKRAVYEELGGFSPDARSAFDWEMWKRIAARHPVWYVPEVLAWTGRGPSALSIGLMRSGEQVADGLATIEISRPYLPPDRADMLSARARERLALYAIEVARRYLERGDEGAALANLRVAFADRPTDRVVRAAGAALAGRADEIPF